ncbi:MAG: hypothetical protein BGO21_02935 [Dyadobacter sp. 50-39]|uniref:response regulator n=1 Tax=Dyadobacter sp. 50-39 TaxID=1895756 RepID=UPI000959811E|nr:response regulator [Dyadobacter sp. 50-39]OJV12716.1 MAG: hypothetical protein BGO21_02935 [Dyadobacter sp. 50-39]
MKLNFVILLVDDDEDDRQIFVEAMKVLKLSAQVVQATNGLHALGLIKDPAVPKPDIMIFDLNMPRMNGLELLCAVRAQSGCDQIPIVIYSTSSRPEDINQCLASGADTYLPKHSSFAQLCKDLLGVFQQYISGDIHGDDQV